MEILFVRRKQSLNTWSKEAFSKDLKEKSSLYIPVQLYRTTSILYFRFHINLRYAFCKFIPKYYILCSNSMILFDYFVCLFVQS